MTEEQPLLPEVIKIKDVLTIATENLPLMSVGSAKAVAAMQAITTCESQERYDEIEALLVKVRNAYTKINAMRTAVTGPLDEFKSLCMQYEKPLGDTDKNSEYNRVRGILAKFKQDELEKKKQVEAEAARKKIKADHLVDVGSKILQNLADAVMRIARKSDEDSKKYFDASTLENFDSRADLYNKMKPSLKQPEYDKCFEVAYRTDVFTPSEFTDIRNTLKDTEPLSKWNDELIKLATPIVNAWRAKIPDLKQNLVNLKNAGDEAERNRIAAEQKKKADEEEARRKAELDAQQQAAQLEIQGQATMSKMENSFVEQATVQQAGETGPTKLVLKFNEFKDVPKALATIIYHCLAHPKFGGTIQKKDRKGNLVVDAQGRPEYIDEVQKWINFFLANCDADVPGTTVMEDAKIAVRA